MNHERVQYDPRRDATNYCSVPEEMTICKFETPQKSYHARNVHSGMTPVARAARLQEKKTKKKNRQVACSEETSALRLVQLARLQKMRGLHTK